jgi:hypothetical protein
MYIANSGLKQGGAEHLDKFGFRSIIMNQLNHEQQE